jgi:hypothetical protein
VLVVQLLSVFHQLLLLDLNQNIGTSFKHLLFFLVFKAILNVSPSVLFCIGCLKFGDVFLLHLSTHTTAILNLLIEHFSHFLSVFVHLSFLFGIFTLQVSFVLEHLLVPLVFGHSNSFRATHFQHDLVV